MSTSVLCVLFRFRIVLVFITVFFLVCQYKIYISSCWTSIGIICSERKHWLNPQQTRRACFLNVHCLLAETKNVHEQCGIENRTGERYINKHIISRSKQCTDTTLYLVILKTSHGVKNVINTGSGTLKLHMSTIWEP